MQTILCIIKKNHINNTFKNGKREKPNIPQTNKIISKNVFKEKNKKTIILHLTPYNDNIQLKVHYFKLKT